LERVFFGLVGKLPAPRGRQFAYQSKKDPPQKGQSAIWMVFNTSENPWLPATVRMTIPRPLATLGWLPPPAPLFDRDPGLIKPVLGHGTGSCVLQLVSNNHCSEAWLIRHDLHFVPLSRSLNLLAVRRAGWSVSHSLAS